MREGYRVVFRLLVLSGLLFTGVVQGAIELKKGPANPNDIQVVPMERTPEPGQVSIRLEYPKNGSIQTKQPVEMQMRLDWFPLGVDSGNFPRRNMIDNSNRGQTVHVFIDNLEYFDKNEALFDALDDHDQFYDQTTEFDLPYKLSPGMHIVRAFPCRSFRESLKEGNPSIASVFYIDEKTPTINMDLSGPYLTYNEPQGSYSDATQPILLDFYISNCTLSKDGYKVRLTIDGTNKRFLYDWVPYFIYGLPVGTHTVQLELMNPQNEIVPGVFNKVARTITVGN